MSKKVVTLSTAVEERDRAAEKVAEILGPALIKERQANEIRQKKIDQLTKNIAKIGQENDELKSKKGGSNFDISKITKQYANILYKEVKSELDDETIKAAEKYLR